LSNPLSYQEFPESVKQFVSYCFKDCLSKYSLLDNKLQALYISFEPRPLQYPDYVKAELILPNKIAYFDKGNIRWDGIMHEITHLIQYHLNGKEENIPYLSNYSKVASFNFENYQKDESEVHAFKIQAAFVEYRKQRLNWNSIKVSNSSLNNQTTYYIYDAKTGIFIKEVYSLEEISQLYGISPAFSKRAIENNWAMKGVYILDASKEKKKRLRIPNRQERESEIRGVKIIGTNPETGTEYSFNSVSEAARELHINRLSIIHVLKERQGTAGGMKWRYAENSKKEINKNQWLNKTFVLNDSTKLEVVDVNDAQEPIFVLRDVNTKKLFRYNESSLRENILKGMLVEISQNKLSWQVETNEFYELERLLNNKHYSYHLEGNTFIIDHGGNVYLYSLTSLPDNIQFNNRGYVDLDSLTSLPNNIQFNNEGNVYLYSLTSLPDNTQFNNRGNVYLNSLTSLPDNIQFNNEGNVDLRSLKSLPDNIQFNNRGNVYLDSLTSLPDNIQFNNRGNVYLDSLTSLPDNKYDIFKNGGGIVYYNNYTSQFNPKDRKKLSWQDVEDLTGWMVRLENTFYGTLYGIVLLDLPGELEAMWRSSEGGAKEVYYYHKNNTAFLTKRYDKRHIDIFPLYKVEETKLSWQTPQTWKDFEGWLVKENVENTRIPYAVIKKVAISEINQNYVFVEAFFAQTAEDAVRYYQQTTDSFVYPFTNLDINRFTPIRYIGNQNEQ
jgi:hypothetical protein